MTPGCIAPFSCVVPKPYAYWLCADGIKLWPEPEAGDVIVILHGDIVDYTPEAINIERLEEPAIANAYKIDGHTR